jgi:5'-nucleotidase
MADDMRKKPWVLLDIGNVFLVDEPLMALVWIEMYSAAKALGLVSRFEEMMVLREQAVSEGLAGAPHDVVGDALMTPEQRAGVRAAVIAKRDADFLRCCFPVAGAKETLGKLKNDFRLAMAANQPEGSFRKAMQDVGLIDCFDVVGISDEVGLKKPDRRFFDHVLDAAGCVASETVMVGDRIDNDIAPAQRMGMKTVQVTLSPEAAGYLPTGELECLYLESLARVPGRGPGVGNETVRADRVVTEIEALPDAVRDVMGVR